MFADSLLESAPQAAHHSAWSKFVSIVLQSVGLSIALAISLLHVDRLQVTPPPPSIRMTSLVDQPVHVRASSSGIATNTASILRVQPIIEPNRIPTSIARVIVDRKPLRPLHRAFHATGIAEMLRSPTSSPQDWALFHHHARLRAGPCAYQR